MKYKVLTVAILILLASCKSEQKIDLELKQETGQALGTSYSILYFAAAEMPTINKSLDSIFTVVNKSMSTYIATSDISKINKGDDTVVVDHMFKEVLETSKVIYTQTDGYFDPTVGNLVNAWGFGPQKHKLAMTPITVDSLMQYIGLDKIKLSANNTLKKSNPNVYIDFNAIAKGYCIDRIGVYLESKNIVNYLIELGGELLAKGTHLEKKSPWAVGIDDPTQKEERTLYTTLALKDRGMATSGNYRKFRLDSLTGKKYVHIVDAKTGYTKPSNILSVSVLAHSCAIADGYATAFMAMPLEKTKVLLANDKSLEAYIIYSSKAGELKTYATDGFIVEVE